VVTVTVVTQCRANTVAMVTKCKGHSYNGHTAGVVTQLQWSHSVVVIFTVVTQQQWLYSYNGHTV